MTHGQHASASAEWWTPPEIVDPARELFGGFDLDPASCEEANRIVKARRIYTAKDDGRRQDWSAAVVWCNPPSEKGKESAWEWWLHCARQWQDRHTEWAWFMVFNPSTFYAKAQAEARRLGLPTPQHAARVEFFDRVRYLRATPQIGLFEAFQVERGEAPPHGSALLLLTRDTSDYARLAKAYTHLGETLVPYMEFT